MPECVMLLLRLKSRLEKDAVSAGLNKTFCVNLSPLTPQKLKKNNAFCLPLIAFPQRVHSIRIEKQTSISS